MQEQFDTRYEETKKQSFLDIFQNILETIKQLIIIWYGFSLLINKTGNLTLGVITTFLRYGHSINFIHHTLQDIYNVFGLERQLPVLEKIYNILHYEPLVKHEQGEALAQVHGNISFEGVGFQYPGTNVKVLDQITFTIQKGEYVAVVGQSGSGKSTLMKLIERFYDTTEGAIKIDGKPIKEINMASLRQYIGYVPQTPTLFNETIEKNIVYGLAGKPYSPEQLEEVCRVSGCLSFIKDSAQFPKGFDTVVGERGVKLSGGQVQRIAIARALMIRPKILIFDEATSSLDSENEHIVLDGIRSLISLSLNITIIVVAHRLSSIKKCNKIIVLKNGRFIEEGTHEQLL